MQIYNQKQSTELTMILLIVSFVSFLKLIYGFITPFIIQLAWSISYWRMLVYHGWFEAKGEVHTSSRLLLRLSLVWIFI